MTQVFENVQEGSCAKRDMFRVTIGRGPFLAVFMIGRCTEDIVTHITPHLQHEQPCEADISHVKGCQKPLELGAFQFEVFLHPSYSSIANVYITQLANGSTVSFRKTYSSGPKTIAGTRKT